MELDQADLEIQQELLLHSRNDDIEFSNDPYHRYLRYYGGGEVEEYNGITSLIGKYAPFEKKKILYAVAKKRSRIEGRKVTTDEIEEEWQEARDKGDRTHKDLEQWGQTGSMPDRPASKKAVRWLNKKGFKPIAFEHVIYDDRIKRATAVDLICLDQQHRIVPMDYKTSKEIRYRPYVDGKGNAKFMEYPLTHIPTANFFQYSIQTSLPIKWLRELYFKDDPYIRVSNRGWILHVRDGEFEPVPALYMGPAINRIYNWENKINNA